MIQRARGRCRSLHRSFLRGSIIYASADGSGFLQITGKYADAWRARIADLQSLYREGIRRLDRVSREIGGEPFAALAETDQDRALEALSGSPKPTPVVLAGRTFVSTGSRTLVEDSADFFKVLVMHTRQGFYSDPVYGGNKDFVGWRAIGFPGPSSLRDTMNGTFELRRYWTTEYDWVKLIPHLSQPRK